MQSLPSGGLFFNISSAASISDFRPGQHRQHLLNTSNRKCILRFPAPPIPYDVRCSLSFCFSRSLCTKLFNWSESSVRADRSIFKSGQFPMLLIFRFDVISSSCNIIFTKVHTIQLYTPISRPPIPKIPCPQHRSRRRSDRHPTKPTLSIAKMALCSSIAAFPYLQPTKCQGSAHRPRHHTMRTRQTARLKIRNCQGQSEYRFLVV